MNNFALRTLAGAGFVAVMLCGLLLSEYLFAAIVIFIMIVMMQEFYSMTMGRRNMAGRILAVSTGALAFILLFLYQKQFISARLLALPLAGVVASLASALFSKDGGQVGDYAFIGTGLVYIALPLSLSNFLVFDGGEFGGLLMLCFFILIWSSDVGAYVVGMAFGRGRRQLAPEISPKKTVVGFFGGLVFAIAASAAIVFIMHYPWYHALALAIIMNISGVAGDLFESLWKRRFGVKDSGSIIPGHGGLLDRFDSSLFAMPLGAIYLSTVGLL